MTTLSTTIPKTTTERRPGAARIGLDVDGVLAHFTGGFLSLLGQLTGRRCPDDYVQRTWSGWWEYTSTDVSRAWDATNNRPYWWQQLKPLDGVQTFLNGVNALADNGDAEITFITSRPAHDARQQTVKWLRTYGYYSHPQVFVVKHAADKGTVARLLALDLIVDDYWGNLQAVALESPDTIPVLYCQPWNEPHRQDFVHVHGLDELFNQLAQYAAAVRAGLPAFTRRG